MKLKTKRLTEIENRLNFLSAPPLDTPEDVKQQMQKEYQELLSQLHNLGWEYDIWDGEVRWSHYTDEDLKQLEEGNKIELEMFGLTNSKLIQKSKRRERLFELEASRKEVIETTKNLTKYFELFNEPKVLRDNQLHNILKQDENYRLFYTLFRLEIYGNYIWIPYLYLIFLQSYGYAKEKFKITNITKNGRINLIGFKESGGGKSMMLNFVANLLQDEFQISTKVLQNPGTVANLRGTVYSSASDKDKDIDIAYGINSHYFIGFDEMKTLLRGIYRNEDLGGFFLGLMENKYVDAGTIESRKILKIWKNKLKKSKSSAPMTIPLKTKFYRIRTNTKNTIDPQSTLEFKNNSNIIILGQPITTESMQTEKNQQIAFGLSTGFYFRALFIWEKEYYIGEVLQNYEQNRLDYSTKLKKYLKIDNIIDLKQHITVKLINNLNKKQIFNYAHDFIKLKSLATSIIEKDPNFQIIESDINNELQYLNGLSHINKHLVNYLSRVKNEYISYLIYTVCFALDLVTPTPDIYKAVISELGKMLINFKEYLEEIDTGDKFSKDLQVKDYAKNIIKFIKHTANKNYSKSKLSGSMLELDLLDFYPFKAKFMEKFKVYSKLVIGDKFVPRIYHQALDSLEKFNKIKITNYNWNKDKRFLNNAYKIILLDDTGGVLDFRDRGNKK